MAGATTTNPVTITVTGSDTNVGINLVTKGTGTVQANGAAVLTGNQTITLSGDVSGSGATVITATLATIDSNIGIYQGIVNRTGLTAADPYGYLIWPSDALFSNLFAVPPSGSTGRMQPVMNFVGI